MSSQPDPLPYRMAYWQLPPEGGANRGGPVVEAEVWIAAEGAAGRIVTTQVVAAGGGLYLVCQSMSAAFVQARDRLTMESQALATLHAQAAQQALATLHAQVAAERAQQHGLGGVAIASPEGLREAMRRRAQGLSGSGAPGAPPPSR